MAARLDNLQSLALVWDAHPPRVIVFEIPAGNPPRIQARITDGGVGVGATALIPMAFTNG